MANQKQAARAAAAAQQKAAQAKNDKRNMIIGIIAVLLVAAVGLWAVLGGKDKPAENNQPQATISGPTARTSATPRCMQARTTSPAIQAFATEAV